MKTTKKSFEQTTLFQTDLYSTQLKDVDHKKIIKYLNKIDKSAVDVKASNYGGWHSSYYFEPFPSCVDDLNKKINSFVKKTARKDFNIVGDTVIHNSWFIINKKGDFNKPHKHPPYVFSGVYYIKCDDNSGDLVFNTQAEMNNYATHYKEFNKYNSKDFYVKPQIGQLLIWPAWVEHYVTPNKSNSERIIYSFNI